METLITQVVKEIPVAGALIFVMWMFLRHMKQREEGWLEAAKEISKRMDDQGASCTTAIKDNTAVLSELKTLIKARIKQHE